MCELVKSSLKVAAGQLEKESHSHLAWARWASGHDQGSLEPFQRLTSWNRWNGFHISISNQRPPCSSKVWMRAQQTSYW